MSAQPIRWSGGTAAEHEWMFGDQGWQLQARCAGVDPETFHNLNTKPQRDQAKATCAECPVRQACLEHALSSPWSPSGIWGGLDQGEVVRLWRERHPFTSPSERHLQVAQLIGLP